jgi:hypothetical protein
MNCNNCDKTDPQECYLCENALPGSEYQRAWSEFRKSLDGHFSTRMVLEIKKLMHKAMQEAKK